MNGWQPIETAPKDGTRVLLFDAGRSPPNMIAHWDWNRWCGDKTISGRFTIWADVSGAYWMPLPSPPSLKGE